MLRRARRITMRVAAHTRMNLFSFIYQKHVRDIFWQAVVLAGLLGLVAFFVDQRLAQHARRRHRVRLRFPLAHRRHRGAVRADQLHARSRTTGRCSAVGIVNTMLITLISAAAATVLGFLIGIARLSRNWLLVDARRRLCRSRAQHPAAVLRAVLVLRRDRRPARPAPVDPDLRRRVPQQSRAHHPAAELRRRRSARPRSSSSARSSSRSASPGGRGGAATAPARTRRCGPSARCCSSCCRSSR